MWNVRNGQVHKIEIGGQGTKRKGGVTPDGYVFFLEGKVMKIFRNEVSVMVIQLCEFCEYAKTTKLDKFFFFFLRGLIFIYLFTLCLRSGYAVQHLVL